MEGLQGREGFMPQFYALSTLVQILVGMVGTPWYLPEQDPLGPPVGKGRGPRVGQTGEGSYQS